MIVTTSGIVLHALPYSDTSIIAKIYTEAFGIQSYLVNAVRSPKAKFKIGLFQPLTLLELVVYHKNNCGLQRINDLKISHPLHSIYSNAYKNAIALFLAEILYRSLKEETSNPDLFLFLTHHILQLESEEKHPANFHLKFMAEYTAYHGFYPQIPEQLSNSFFDLKTGCFSKAIPSHPFFLSIEESKLFHNIFISKSSNLPLFSIAERRSLIRAFINYYEFHLPSFHEIKSHKIFEQLAG